MAFEYVVQTLLRFNGNGPQYLSRLTGLAEKAAVQVERLTKAAEDASLMMERYGKITGGAADSTGLLDKAVSTNSGRFTRQAAAIDKAAAAMDRYGIAADRARIASSSVGRGGPSGGPSAGGEGWSIAGLLAGAAAFVGLKGAGDLEQSLNQIDIAGVSNRQLPQVHAMARRMSSFTAQTEAQSTALLKVMATSGLNSIPGISTYDALRQVSTPIAQFADVNYLQTGKKHMEFEDSAVLASGLAHDMRIYQTAKMTSFLTTLARVGNMTGDGPSVIGTMIRAFAPAATRYGMSPADIANIAALTDRAGQSTRGGTGLNQILQNIVAPRGKVKMSALERIGVYREDGTSPFIDQKSGNVAFEKFLRFVADYEARMKASGRGQEANRNLARGFDVNSNRVLGAIATEGMLKMLDRMRGREKTMPNLQQMQITLMKGFNSQVQLATSNFRTMTTEMMFGLLPALTNVATGIGGAFSNTSNFFGNHPFVADVTGVTAMAAGVAGMIKMIQIGHGIVGISKHIGGETVSLFLRLGKEFGRGFGILTKATESKFTTPIFEAANKLGPIGTRISSFAFGLGTNTTLVESAASRFLLSLARFAPGINVAAMVLTTQSPAGGPGDELTPAQQRAQAARGNAYRRSLGDHVEIHGNVVVHANSATAGQEAGEAFLRALKNPQAVIQRARHSTRIPAPAFGIPALSTGRH